MKTIIFLAFSFALTAMETPKPGTISKSQLISLAESFLKGSALQALDDNAVCYHHYENSTQLFTQDRANAFLHLTQLKEKAADPIFKSNYGPLLLRLHRQLDHTKAYMPQINQDDLLTVQADIVHRIFTLKIQDEQGDEDDEDYFAIATKDDDFLVLDREEEEAPEKLLLREKNQENRQNFIKQLAASSTTHTAINDAAQKTMESTSVQKNLESLFNLFNIIHPDLFESFSDPALMDTLAQLAKNTKITP